VEKCILHLSLLTSQLATSGSFPTLGKIEGSGVRLEVESKEDRLNLVSRRQLQISAADLLENSIERASALSI
jgi:hypothetical protein